MSDNFSNSRRNFLKRIRGYATNSYPHSKYPRPPWALSNTDFLEECKKCGLCAKACSQKVITFSDEANPLLNGLPILSLEYNSCNFCQDCVKACSSKALDLTLGIKKQTIAKVDYESCDLALGYFCEQCFDVCTTQAIDISNNMVNINEEECQGCAECVVACTNQAISMHKYN